MPKRSWKRRSGAGAHQFDRPNIVMMAGTTMVRTMIASMRTATTERHQITTADFNQYDGSLYDLIVHVRCSCGWAAPYAVSYDAVAQEVGDHAADVAEFEAWMMRHYSSLPAIA